MKIGIRFYGESRQNFEELEVATRCDGKLAAFVELVEAQGFKNNDTVEQIFVKVSTRPGSTPTRNLTSLEMLGELFKIFGHFPLTGGLPREITELVYMDIHNAAVLIGSFVEAEVGREDVRKRLLGYVEDIYKAEKKFAAAVEKL